MKYFICLGTPVLGTPFAPFPTFGSPPALLTSAQSHRPLPHHHHQQPTPQATFFPPPFLYWSYPSPPVSPTAYYGQPPTHSTTSLAGNITATQHQAMYPLDFLPTVQTSTLSPPNITISSSSTFMPPKQISTLPPPVVPFTNGVTGGSVGSRNGVSGLSKYHTKMALSLPMSQQQTSVYHYTAPPSVTGSAQPALLSLPTTPAAAPPLTLTRTATLGALPTVSTRLAIPNTTLLTVDTTHNEQAPALKLTTSSAKRTGKIPFDVTTSNVEMVSNSCMELYIA